MSYKENGPTNSKVWERAVGRFNKGETLVYRTSGITYRLFSKKIEGKRILDAGCGLGVGTSLLHGLNVVTGIDKEEENIRFAKEVYPHLWWEVWDFEKEVFPGEFDIVVCVEVIEHIKDYKRAIWNLMKMAKETLFLSTPNRKDPRHPQDHPASDLHVREFTVEEIISFVGDFPVKIRNLEFEEHPKGTRATPLIYEIDVRSLE